MYERGLALSPEAIVKRSWSFAHQAQYEDALKLLLTIPEKERSHKWSIAYSNYLFNQGKTDEAIKHLEYSLGFSARLEIKENERRTPLTQKNYKVYAALAHNYLVVNRAQEALYIFRKRANLLYPTVNSQQNIPNQEYILATAELALKIGKNNLAITYFNKLRSSFRDTPQQLFKIPPLKSLDERRVEAYPVARLFGLALAHENTGEITQSFFYYAELLQRFPFHQEGLKNFYKMIKHYDVVEGVSLRDEGMKLLRELAKEYPQQSFLQTIVAKLEQEPAQKRTILEKLKLKFPYQHEIDYALAKVCRKQRDYDEALEYALTCQQNNPALHQEKIRSMITRPFQINIATPLQACFALFPQARSYLVGLSAHACLENRALTQVNIVVNTTYQNFLLHDVAPCPYNENLFNADLNGMSVNYYFSPICEEVAEKFLFEDALTRDFTYNCLYIDAQGMVHDPLLGLARSHYQQSILSTPIPANISFEEDPTRLLLALAAITRGYTPTDEVWDALNHWQPTSALDKDHCKAIMRKDLRSFNEEQIDHYLDLLRSTNLAYKLFNISASLVSRNTLDYVLKKYKQKLDFFAPIKPVQAQENIEVHPNFVYDEPYSKLIVERINNSPFI